MQTKDDSGSKENIEVLDEEILTWQELGEKLKLKCKTRHAIRRLEKRGMPRFYVGDSPRYIWRECLEWMRNEGVRCGRNAV